MSGLLLITGGASGIGAAVARLAAPRGFAIAINYRSRRAAADALVSELAALGATARAFQADVSRPHDVEKLYEDVQRELGRPTAV